MYINVHGYMYVCVYAIHPSFEFVYLYLSTGCRIKGARLIFKVNNFHYFTFPIAIIRKPCTMYQCCIYVNISIYLFYLIKDFLTSVLSFSTMSVFCRTSSGKCLGKSKIRLIRTHFRPLVWLIDWLVGRMVGWLVCLFHNLLKGRKVSLPCSYLIACYGST